MSKSNHTPGPWNIWKPNLSNDPFLNVNGQSPIVGSHDAPVCYIPKDGTLGTRRSNARLISSAPDLLQALKNIALMANTSGDKCILEEAREAIAKAEGKL